MATLVSVLDLVGWVGGGATVVAYVLVSTRRWEPDSVVFQATNIVGGALLASASFSRGALPSACLNIVWIAFGGQVLLAARRRRRRERAGAALADAPVRAARIDGDLEREAGVAVAG